jgi:hypothetical protein
MKKPCALKFIKTLRLAMILVCLFVMSCSKEEDPAGAAGETDTTSSPSTTPGSTGSGNDGTGVGVIVPDIRRGINTQQFFIGKDGNNYNKFPWDGFNDSAVDSQGNHIAAGFTVRNFIAPYIFDLNQSSDLDRNIFVIKTNPTGEISWVFTLDEFSKDQHFPTAAKFQLTTGIVDEFTKDDISLNGSEQCVSVSVDIDDNIYCLASFNRKKEATEVEPARYTQIASKNDDSSFILLKINPDGELVWVRQFGETLNLNLSFYMTTTDSNYFTHDGNRSMEFTSDKSFTPRSMKVVGNKILIVGTTSYNLVSETSGEISDGGGVLIEYDLQGSLKNVFQSPDSDYNYNDIVVDETSGNIFIGGKAGHRPLVINLSKDYNLNWKQTFSSTIITNRASGGTFDSSCQQVQVDQNENAYCIGTTRHPLGDESIRNAANTDYDLFLAKIHYLGYIEYITQLDDSYAGPLEAVDTSGTEFFSDSILLGHNLYILGATEKSIGDTKQPAPLVTDNEGEPVVEKSQDALLATFDITSGELRNVQQLGSSYFEEYTYIAPTSIHFFNERFFATAGVLSANDAFCLPDIPDEGKTFYEDAPLDGYNSVLFDLTYRLEHKKNVKNIPCVIGPIYDYYSDLFSEFFNDD